MVCYMHTILKYILIYIYRFTTIWCVHKNSVYHANQCSVYTCSVNVHRMQCVLVNFVQGNYTSYKLITRLCYRQCTRKLNVMPTNYIQWQVG